MDLKYLSLVCSILMFSATTYGQQFGCPLHNGKIIEPKQSLFTFTDPANGIRIFSPDKDSVKAVSHGKVMGIYKSIFNDYSVLIKQNDTIIGYKWMRSAFVTKDQIVDAGSLLGMARATDSTGFKVDLTLWVKGNSINCRDLIQCKKED